MKILVVNDDGIAAPGLRALAESLKSVGEVVVVAPDREQSGVGCSVTLHQAVRSTPVASLVDGVDTYAVEGTPGDSVILATSTLVKEPIDLVVSGINSGSNLGNDVLVSGTVGAAFHGYFRRIPSIALSVISLTDIYLDAASRLASLLALRVKEGILPKEILLNVNLPNKPIDEIKGVLVTRLSGNSYSEVVEEGKDIRRRYYWINRARPVWQMEEGTDVWAVQNDYISVTPIHSNLTDHSQLPQLEKLDLHLDGSFPGPFSPSS